MYSLLFKAASKTLTKLALDKKYLGAQIGVTMVLHTWGQNLSFIPISTALFPVVAFPLPAISLSDQG